MNKRVQGRGRLRTDGLRERDPGLEKQRLREAQQQVAEEAARQRQVRQSDNQKRRVGER